MFVRLLSFQTGDRSGELTARMNMSDLQTILGLSYSVNSSTLSENKEMDYNSHGRFFQGVRSQQEKKTRW